MIARMIIAAGSLIAALSIAAPAEAQRASARSIQDTAAVETTQCSIASTGVSRSGTAFVCEAGDAGCMLIASDGGTPAGGVSSITSWLIDARSRQTSARSSVTVRHAEPGQAEQRICDEFALRGASNRQPMTCRALVSVHG